MPAAVVTSLNFAVGTSTFTTAGCGAENTVCRGWDKAGLRVSHSTNAPAEIARITNAAKDRRNARAMTASSDGSGDGEDMRGTVRKPLRRGKRRGTGQAANEKMPSAISV
jgi:hypothetical protein